MAAPSQSEPAHYAATLCLAQTVHAQRSAYACEDVFFTDQPITAKSKNLDYGSKV